MESSPYLLPVPISDSHDRRGITNDIPPRTKWELEAKTRTHLPPAWFALKLSVQHSVDTIRNLGADNRGLGERNYDLNLVADFETAKWSMVS